MTMKIKFLEQNKILIAVVLCSLSLVRPVLAQPSEDLFQKGVAEYRKGNTQECLGIMQSLEKKDPTNAYVEYYLAMAQAKLGNTDEAKAKYEQVILINQDTQLVSYAKEGIKNIEKVLGKAESSDVKEKKETKFIDKPFLKAENESGKVQKNSVSDEEIAKAIKVLRDAGLLNVQVGVTTPSAPQNTVDPNIMQQNAEMMNMNMLMSSMGGGSKGSGMDMMPFLMMQQQQGANGGKSNISPEIIQMMMNNSMLEGLGTFDTNKDK